MRIGLDFDGVITDTQKLKAEIAKEVFQRELPPHLAKEHLVVEHGLMTRAEYRELMTYIAARRDVGLRMTPKHRAIENIQRLQSKGHELIVITSRDGEEVAIAREWCRNHSLTLPIISVGYGGSKIEAAKGCLAYIDDDLHKLLGATN